MRGSGASSLAMQTCEQRVLLRAAERDGQTRPRCRIRPDVVLDGLRLRSTGSTSALLAVLPYFGR
eukprot:2443066-Alexandrium_andersonii.AAC.1